MKKPDSWHEAGVALAWFLTAVIGFCWISVFLHGGA